jgi:hypothetical protein
MKGQKVIFNADNFKEFRELYRKAKEDKVDTFVFEGRDYLVGYAKHVIEYLEPALKGAPS